MILLIIMFWLMAHWIADFILQSSYMAQNKSKSWRALSLHCATYAGFMTICAWVYAFYLNVTVLPTSFFIIYAYFFLTHIAIDAVTSRITAFLYAKGDYHNFFCVIGFDQILHYAVIFIPIFA